MKNALLSLFALPALALVLGCHCFAAQMPDTSIRVDSQQQEVRYVSGKAAYVEALIGGRLVGRSWSFEGGAPPNRGGNDSAFQLQIATDPRNEQSEQWLNSGWQWISSGEQPKNARGDRHFVIELANSAIPVTVRVHTLLDGTPVFERWLEITNHSQKAIAITALAPWSGKLWQANAPVYLGHSMRNDVRWEGWYGWTKLSPGLNTFKSDRDRLWDDPYFVLRNASNHEYFFGELAWAATYRMEFNDSNGLSFSIGPATSAALRVVEPGETVTTPAVHLGYTHGDFDDAVQAMHSHIRETVSPRCPLGRCYRAQYLIPEDWPMTVYRADQFNEANIKKCIDVAAAAGLEAFILDGPMWTSSYGNWLVPDRKRFPNGLKPLVDYAHRKGLMFGAYFETEGGRDGFTSRDGNRSITIGKWKNSEVYQQHPEWFSPGLNLDLSIPEAASYLDSEVNRIVDFYHLDIYRHDQNGIVMFPPGPGAGETLRDGFIESNYWRHYDALDQVFADVQANHPDLILQQAAAGNIRLDLSTAGVFREEFTSDRATMPYVYRMLSGMSVYLPPEILVNSNGMAWPQDQPDLDTTLRGAYALGNTPMLFNFILPKSLEDMTPQLRQRFLHYAGIYKNFIRPVLPTCKVYHHAPVNETGGVESGNWFAMEFAAPDHTRDWAVIIRLAKTEKGAYHLNFKGLDSSKQYQVTFDNSGRETSLRGSALMRDGVSIQLPADRDSELVLLQAE